MFVGCWFLIQMCSRIVSHIDMFNGNYLLTFYGKHLRFLTFQHFVNYFPFVLTDFVYRKYFEFLPSGYSMKASNINGHREFIDYYPLYVPG